MKFFSSLAFTLFVSTSSLCLASFSKEDVQDTQDVYHSSFSFIEALERNFLPKDDERIKNLFIQGLSAENIKDLPAALEAYSEMARYGDFRAYVKIATCYANQNQILNAFKWMVWATQEANLQDVEKNHPFLKKCFDFLNNPDNQQRLSLSRRLKKAKWPFRAFEQIDWSTEKNHLVQREFWLTSEELKIKKNLFQALYYLESSSKFKEKKEEITADPQTQENIMRIVKRINNLKAECFIIDMEQDLTEKTYLLEKIYNYTGGAKKILEDCKAKIPLNNINKTLFIARNIVEHYVRLSCTGDNAQEFLLKASDICDQFIFLYKKYNLFSKEENMAELFFYMGFTQELCIYNKFIAGCMHKNGPNFKQILNHYSQSVKICPLPRSYINMAKNYLLYGETEEDYIQAREYALQAVALNGIEGYSFLFKIYLEGLGVERSFDKAFEYYMKASNAGYQNGNLEIIQDLITAKRYKEALQILNTLKVPAYTYLAWLHSCQGNIEEGLKYVEMKLPPSIYATMSETDKVHSFITKITFYLNAKIFSNSCNYDERILQLKDKIDNVLPVGSTQKDYFKGYIDFFRGDYKSAVEHFNNFHKAEPHSYKPLILQAHKKLVKQLQLKISLVTQEIRSSKKALNENQQLEKRKRILKRLKESNPIEEFKRKPILKNWIPLKPEELPVLSPQQLNVLAKIASQKLKIKYNSVLSLLKALSINGEFDYNNATGSSHRQVTLKLSNGSLFNTTWCSHNGLLTIPEINTLQTFFKAVGIMPN